MNKHTPGPWTRYTSVIKSRKADCIVVRLPALTDCVGDESPEQIERWDADARLIAAAPELLEALQDLLRLVEDNWLQGPEWDADEWVSYSRYRDVIAKAQATDY